MALKWKPKLSRRGRCEAVWKGPFQVQTKTNAKSLRHQLDLDGSRAES